MFAQKRTNRREISLAQRRCKSASERVSESARQQLLPHNMHYLPFITMDHKSSSHCAFCSPAPLPSALKTTTTTSTTTPTHVVAITCTITAVSSSAWSSFVPRTSFTLAPKKRPRLHVSLPQKRPVIVSVFNSNGNNNGNGRGDVFAKQSLELLVSTARFFQSPSGQVVLWFGLIWLVLTGRVGFIFDSFVFLFAFITIAPVLAFLTFRWWLSRQLVQGTCPSCGATVTGLKGQSFPCTVCGNTVQGEKTGSFSVKDPTTATIDIDAKQVED